MNNSSADLAEFFSGLEDHLELFSRFKLATDKYLSTDFNVIDYTSRDENTYSDIISDLLNPDGGHGQGVVFLRNFLDILSDRNEHNNAHTLDTLDIVRSRILDPECQIVVDRERATANISNSKRRMDIVLDFGDASIVIENKPFALDQEEQISDYLADAEQRTLHSIVVYISGDGSPPSQLSIKLRQRETLEAQGRFFVISYSIHLDHWLAQCIKESESEKLRWFLRDLRSSISNEFPPYDEVEQ